MGEGGRGGRVHDVMDSDSLLKRILYYGSASTPHIIIIMVVIKLRYMYMNIMPRHFVPLCILYRLDLVECLRNSFQQSISPDRQHRKETI